MKTTVPPAANPETADAAAKINMTTPGPSSLLQGSRLTMAPDSKAVNVDELLTINPVQRSAPFTTMAMSVTNYLLIVCGKTGFLPSENCYNLPCRTADNDMITIYMSRSVACWTS
jgi:hypothetical protein